MWFYLYQLIPVLYKILFLQILNSVFYKHWSYSQNIRNIFNGKILVFKFQSCFKYKIIQNIYVIFIITVFCFIIIILIN